MENIQGERWRVLLIDQDEEGVQKIRSMLDETQGRKFHLDWAPSYCEGQALLESKSYQAVLIDQDLGARTGIELIREAVARDYPVPFILYSAHWSYEIDVQAMQAGAAYYLSTIEATPQLLERAIRYAIEQRRNREKLKRHLQERENILDSIQDGLFSLNQDWQFTYINQRAAQIMGMTPEQLAGRNLWEAFPRIIGSPLEARYRQAMVERTAVQFETLGVYRDVWYSISVYPSREGISIYWQDISERRRLEDEVRRQAQFPDENPNPVLRVSANGELLYANESAKALLHSCGLESPLALPEDLMQASMAVLEAGSAQEVEIFCEGRTFSFTLAPILDRRYVNLYGVEITRRKRMEASLRESEERFRTMADGTPVIIWVTDPEGRIEFTNQAYQDFFGLSQEQIRLDGWQPLIFPDDQPHYISAFFTSLQTQSLFHAEGRVRRGDGQWRRIESFGQPRYSASGEYLGIAGSSIDITDRKHAEEMLQVYTEQLKRSNEALEDFAFTASHDLRAPIRKVKAFTEQLVNQAGGYLDEQSLDYLARMERAAENLQDMLDGLLSYSRVTKQGKPFEYVDLNRVAEEVLFDLDVQLQESGGKVELGELPVILADPVQMRQLLQNLIDNAIKFRKPSTPSLIKIRHKPAAGDMIELSVEDNGIGFDMALADQVFKPFRRLVGKSDYEGSGMGMAICQKIAERHHGTIRAESKSGLGSTFIVTLPFQPPSPV